MPVPLLRSLYVAVISAVVLWEIVELVLQSRNASSSNSMVARFSSNCSTGDGVVARAAQIVGGNTTAHPRVDIKTCAVFSVYGGIARYEEEVRLTRS